MSRNTCILETLMTAAMVTVATTAPGAARTIWVDVNAGDPAADGSAAHPFPAIHIAIEVAVNGDEVVVRDGLYTGPGNKNLDFGMYMPSGTRSITVRSENGPEQCIIDCEGDGRGFIFHRGETASAVLNGFTIRNGQSPDTGGGAILCDFRSNPTIANCRLINNDGGFWGGAIYCKTSSPRITGCLIRGNAAEYGGGISSGLWANPILEECEITGNTARSSGGGIDCSGDSLTVTACTITGNTAGNDGGGINGELFGALTVTDSTITGNRAIDGGGGGIAGMAGAMHATRTTVGGNQAIYGAGISCTENDGTTVTACWITDNVATQEGGGVYCWAGGVTLSSCVLSGNRTENGGAIFADAECADPTAKPCNLAAVNCTIAGNVAGRGAAAYCLESSPTFINCILWNAGADEVFSEAGSPTVRFSNVRGGFTGQDNIQLDPGFAFTDDYHLVGGSPCIDVGTVAPVGGLPATDIEGVARSLDGDGMGGPVPDMGAHEYHPTAPAIAVSPPVITASAIEGASDPLPLTAGIRDAGGGVLNWHLDSQEPWLSADPSDGRLNPGEMQSLSVGISISGLPPGDYVGHLAFSGTGAVNTPRTVEVRLHVAARNLVPSEYPTIQAAIDAAMDGDEVVVADGVYTGEGNRNLDFRGKVITVRSQGGPDACVIDCEASGCGFDLRNWETPAAVVRGFTIRNGNAAFGGGIHCQQSAPTIVECRIIDNRASMGGGIGCNAAGNLTIVNCVIAGNRAVAAFGGRGGGMDYLNSSPIVLNSAITGNLAENGGGICCESDAQPIFVNCTLADNRAGLGQGLLCRRLGESAPPSAPLILNSILWNGDADNGVRNDDGSAITIRYSTVQGGWTGPGEHNINADPMFITAGSWNDSGTPNDLSDDAWTPGDYRLESLSPCVDAGDNTAVAADTTDLDNDGDTGEPIPVDLAGSTRFIDNPFTSDTGNGTAPIVDMGAYEFQATGDSDGDGIPDGQDNCPSTSNTDQRDSDQDGKGDVCDPCPDDPYNDIDNDDLCANEDNCPSRANPGQEDADGDRVGDVCDNCPFAPNADQRDADGDGSGDTCDTCPADASNDADGDGRCGDVDNCPTVFNPDQNDVDGDQAGDACDNCLAAPNPEQADSDRDAMGDICDPCPNDPGNDADQDGVCGDIDNCPQQFNPDQADTDGDGRGDVCDIALFVDVAAQGANTGSTWHDAYTSLQAALDAAASLDCCGSGRCAIWVAAGTYRPSKLSNASDARTASFRLRNCVAIYGGFPPGGGLWRERNPSEHLTTLTGDLGTNDAAGVDGNHGTKQDNCYHVVEGSDTDGSALLDGFTITAGNANGTNAAADGGGMYNNRGSPTVANCKFEANWAAGEGGGMRNTHANPALHGCVFQRNSAAKGGGIMSTSGNPVLTDCRLTGNVARSANGGGMWNGSSSPTLLRCAFTGNTADGGGGAVNNYAGSAPALTDCTFVENTSGGPGGAIENEGGARPLLINCRLVRNSAKNGGGISAVTNSGFLLVNCTVSGNKAWGNWGGGIHCTGGGEATLVGCLLVGNQAARLGGGFHCASAAGFQLSGCTITGNIAGQQGGGVYAGADAAGTVSNCIVWANAPQDMSVFSDLAHVSQCDFQSALPPIACSGTCLCTDPLFMVPGHWNDNGTPGDPSDDMWFDGDYHLRPGSPCVDAGDNTAVPPDTEDIDADGDTAEPIPVDLGGWPRFFEDPNTPDTGTCDNPCSRPIVDLGAYEFETPPLFDFNTDGDVDTEDLLVFESCLTGPSIPYPTTPGGGAPFCLAADADADLDIDQSDFGIFQRCYSGTGKPADPNCVY
ncbi:MAG TPA: right-handed parallel beta-helix repeat-containing protein [Phycisphaerae bacterium]|nr:right-handed parallel beta-helix repeat-containing protein [Phycisphaerae bacterium]HRY70897.1 right-handed parallel beta-helix repeat-containing protein [Phycisphaerae bacterium]HSA29409.1 right-handed parallel beta-helix repeat-containing protein [Phycisphaerae bacterium]